MLGTEREEFSSPSSGKKREARSTTQSNCFSSTALANSFSASNFVRQYLLRGKFAASVGAPIKSDGLPSNHAISPLAMRDLTTGVTVSDVVEV